VTFTASGQTALGKPGRASAPRTVTGTAAQQLASAINRLEVVQPGVIRCPLGRYDVFRPTFRSTAGSSLASAEEHPTCCPYVSLTVGGRAGPHLIDEPSVTDELIRVGAIPVCAAGQLRAAASVPTFDPAGRYITFTLTNRSRAVCRVAGVLT
jgi:hypothetical protein